MFIVQMLNAIIDILFIMSQQLIQVVNSIMLVCPEIDWFIRSQTKEEVCYWLCSFFLFAWCSLRKQLTLPIYQCLSYFMVHIFALPLSKALQDAHQLMYTAFFYIFKSFILKQSVQSFSHMFWFQFHSGPLHLTYLYQIHLMHRC